MTAIFSPKTLVVEAAALVVGAAGVAAGAAAVALPPNTDFWPPKTDVDDVWAAAAPPKAEVAEVVEVGKAGDAVEGWPPKTEVEPPKTDEVVVVAVGLSLDLVPNQEVELRMEIKDGNWELKLERKIGRFEIRRLASQKLSMKITSKTSKWGAGWGRCRSPTSKYWGRWGCWGSWWGGCFGDFWGCSASKWGFRGRCGWGCTPKYWTWRSCCTPSKDWLTRGRWGRSSKNWFRGRRWAAKDRWTTCSCGSTSACWSCPGRFGSSKGWTHCCSWTTKNWGTGTWKIKH